MRILVKNDGIRSFTLIELLIVVAIISIMATSLIAVIVAPMKERRYAEQEMAFEAGSMLLFTSLAEDMHRSINVYLRGNEGVIIEGTGHQAFVYYIDSVKILRRAAVSMEEAQVMFEAAHPPANEPGAPLLEFADALQAEQKQDGRYRFHVTASTRLLDQDYLFSREITLKRGQQP